MKILSVLVGLTMLCMTAIAQQTIRGSIVDRDSKTPLVGAVVQVIGSDAALAAVSDADGQFEISSVPVGRRGIEASYLGYQPLRMEGLLLTQSRELVLTLEMQEAVNELGTVEVSSTANARPLNELTTVSARSFSMEALERQPANFADPARMALNFPGVAISNDDILNDLVIRGNAPSGMLWRLEGIEIPNPNHFATRGGSGGGISMLSANAMSTSDFFTAAFPAEYGNALSGVMDIRMRKGNHHKRETAVQLGLLGLDVATEGPFRKGGEASYLANYRYSTLGILDRLGLSPDGGSIPDFQDLSFKLFLPTEKSGTFSLFGLGGSFVDEELIKIPVPFARQEQFKDTGQTGIIGLSHLYFLSEKTYLKTILSASIANLEYEEAFAENGESLQKRYDETFTDRAARASILLNHKFNAKHLLRIGGIASRLGYGLKMREENYEFTEVNGFPQRIFTGEWTTFLDDNGSANLLQAYAQWKATLTPRLTLNIGAHITHFDFNNDTEIEPRLGLKYKLSERQELTFGIGRHSRTEALALYFVRKENGSQLYRQLPLQNARHLVLGHRVQLGEAWSLHTEAYYQHLVNLPVSRDSTSTFALLNQDFFDAFFRPDVLVGKGEGLNYGIDMNLERRFHRQYYLILNASVFQSKYKTLEGHWHSTRFNTGYNLLMTGGKEFLVGKTKHNTLGLNARFLMNGGQRYTPIDREASLEQQRTVFSKNVFSKHLPAYYRIDLGINYRMPRKQMQYLSLNIQNITDRLNVFSRNQQHVENVEGKIWISDELQTGLIPVLNYRLEF